MTGLRAVGRDDVRRLSRFLGDAAWVSAGQLVAVTSAVITFILLGRTLGAAGYGAYVSFFALLGVVGAGVWAGLPLLVIHQYRREGRSPESVTSVAYSLLYLQSLVAIPVVSLVGVVFLDGIGLLAVVLLAVVELLLTPMSMLAASFLQASVSFRRSTLQQSVPYLAKVAVVVGLWRTDQLDIDHLAIGLALVGLVPAALAASAVTRRGGSLRPRRVTRDDLVASGELSLPMVAVNIQRNGDTFLLGVLGTVTAAGLYGAAWRMVNMAFVPVAALNSAGFFRVMGASEGGAAAELGRMQRVVVVTASISALVGAVLLVAAPAVTWFAGDEFREAETIVRWLAVYLPLASIRAAPLDLLMALGERRFRARILVVGSVLSVVLYVVLIPPFSWQGAVAATLISELAVVVLAHLAARAQVARRVRLEAAGAPAGT